MEELNFVGKENNDAQIKNVWDLGYKVGDAVTIRDEHGALRTAVLIDQDPGGRVIVSFREYKRTPDGQSIVRDKEGTALPEDAPKFLFVDLKKFNELNKNKAN
jgi:hypothetical protein